MGGSHPDAGTHDPAKDDQQQQQPQPSHSSSPSPPSPPVSPQYPADSLHPILQHLHILKSTNKIITLETATKLWIQAFIAGKPEILDKLPPFGFPSIKKGLLLVRSKEMYKKLCTLRPDLCQLDALNDWFGGQSKSKNYPVQSTKEDDDTDVEEDENEHDEEAIDERTRLRKLENHLIQIASRHCWMDELPLIMTSSPTALIKFAIYYGHGKLYRKAMELNGTKFNGDDIPLDDRIQLYSAIASQRSESGYSALIDSGITPPLINEDSIINNNQHGGQPRETSSFESLIGLIIKSGHRSLSRFYHGRISEIPTILETLSSPTCTYTSDFAAWIVCCEIAKICDFDIHLAFPLRTQNEARIVVGYLNVLGHGVLERILDLAAASGNTQVYRSLHQYLPMDTDGGAKTKWIPDMVGSIRRRLDSFSGGNGVGVGDSDGDDDDDEGYQFLMPEAIDLIHRFDRRGCDVQWVRNVRKVGRMDLVEAFGRWCECEEVLKEFGMDMDVDGDRDGDGVVEMKD
ncbi:hypothetical protein HDU76_002616 [Blyttiomyces sp. JEL0837]|nr:hypothetical protein HDU76_002616 [Blyttiomyces sp. JEL0837]